MILLLACVPTDKDALETDGNGGDTDGDTGSLDSADSGDSGDSGDTGEAVSWVPLPAGCEAPATGADPLVRIGRYDTYEDDLFVEFIDMKLQDGLAWTVGQGGLIVIDVTDPTKPELRVAQNNDRYHKVVPLNERLAAVTNRDRGLEVLDIGAGRVDRRQAFGGRGWEGLLLHEDHLYVTSREDGLVVFDASEPTALRELARVAGLTSPWDISAVHDGWAYVADAVEGVVPVDLTDPSAPAFGEAVSLPGASHVTVHDGILYVSMLGDGIVVLDALAPSRPVEVDRVDTGGAAIVSALASGHLVVAAHESIVSLGADSPGDLDPAGHERAAEFALAVGSDGTYAYVGDWTKFDVYAPVATGTPELDFDEELIRLPTEGGSVEITFTNRGAGTLELAGGEAGDSRIQVEASGLSFLPGESGRLRLTYSGGTTPLVSGLCVASNDADGAVRNIPVESGDPSDPVGQPATDFTLPDLDGNYHTLSEHRGYPVFFTYFATW